MASIDEIAATADALFTAYATRKPVAPPRETIADLDLKDAYAIQLRQEQAFKAAGHTVVGRKIGLTSSAMQRQLGVDSPDFGFITDNLSFTLGTPIPADRFISPKVEPELAFVLNKDLGAGATFDHVLSSIESVHRAVEVIDSRIRNWDITLVDTVADNASCGAIVVDPTPLDVTNDQLADVPAQLRVDGHSTGAGYGSDVMGHPLRPLEWLANILGEMGETLRAGQTILTGSFCAAAPVHAGQTIDVDYGPYGTLSIDFV